MDDNKVINLRIDDDRHNHSHTDESITTPNDLENDVFPTNSSGGASKERHYDQLCASNGTSSHASCNELDIIGMGFDEWNGDWIIPDEVDDWDIPETNASRASHPEVDSYSSHTSLSPLSPKLNASSCASPAASRKREWSQDIPIQSTSNASGDSFSIQKRFIPLKTLSSIKAWTKADYEVIINDRYSRIGKFLRDESVTAAEAEELDIMKSLQELPHKERCKYGPRNRRPSDLKVLVSKERNRLHAHATRQRKKIFEKEAKRIREYKERKALPSSQDVPFDSQHASPIASLVVKLPDNAMVNSEQVFSPCSQPASYNGCGQGRPVAISIPVAMQSAELQFENLPPSMAPAIPPAELSLFCEPRHLSLDRTSCDVSNRVPGSESKLQFENSAKTALESYAESIRILSTNFNTIDCARINPGVFERLSDKMAGIILRVKGLHQLVRVDPGSQTNVRISDMVEARGFDCPKVFDMILRHCVCIMQRRSRAITNPESGWTLGLELLDSHPCPLQQIRATPYSSFGQAIAQGAIQLTISNQLSPTTSTISINLPNAASLYCESNRILSGCQIPFNLSSRHNVKCVIVVDLRQLVSTTFRCSTI